MPKALRHPPQYPDLNPIEHLWEYVDNKVRELNISFKDDIKAALQDEWTKIPSEFTKKLAGINAQKARSCDKIQMMTNKILKTIFY